MWLCFSSVLVFTWILSTQVGLNMAYIAAVVEYAPAKNPDMDPEKNIMNNVNNYITFVATAASQKVDIIVFPEIGLKGYDNQPLFSEVPSASEKISPCLFNTTYSEALVKLSCTAEAYNIYIVVNLPEVYYNYSNNTTLHYNTDVVFDRHGIIIARYRKYNLFGEFSINVPELDHVFFDTDFGVRFGVFICFDMEFREPPVTMAQDLGIQHFVYSTAWYSELPFLTAIQAQWSFAYSLNVVLLASGYNDPNSGSSGTGIYQGRTGPHNYVQIESHESRILISTVYTKNDTIESMRAENDVFEKYTEIRSNKNTTKLRMLQDAIHLYETEVILPPTICDTESCLQENSSSTVISYSIYRTLCYGNFCCNFNVTLLATYEKSPLNSTKRGDDYNTLYYRLAVFNGVRTYAGFATGGLQTCSIIPCINDQKDSCGLRSDHSKASQRKIKDKIHGELYQTSVIFNHIEIHSNFDYFSNVSSFIYPDILVSGSGDNFGSLVSYNDFSYQQVTFNGTVHGELKLSKNIQNLITFGIYGRQYNRDGEPETRQDESMSLIFSPNLILLFITSLILIFKYN